MPPKRARRSSQNSTSIISVPSTQLMNTDSTHEDEGQVQEAVLADLKFELAATSARCILQETSIEELKSRISGLEKHVGTQLQLMQQTMSKFVVVVTPTEASEVATHPVPSSRVFELVMSPKTTLKKVMRQAIRQYMFSNSGSIFASSNREALGRKCYFFIVYSRFVQFY